MVIHHFALAYLNVNLLKQYNMKTKIFKRIINTVFTLALFAWCYMVYTETGKWTGMLAFAVVANIWYKREVIKTVRKGMEKDVRRQIEEEIKMEKILKGDE